MSRRNLRLRIADDGGLEVVDPGFDTLRLMRTVDPLFRIRRQELPGFASPRIHRVIEVGCGISPAELRKYAETVLWGLHESAMQALTHLDLAHKRPGEASLLDLKTELVWRMLSACRLCHHRCGVDRTRGEVGRCGLGSEAFVTDHFVHIAEEPPVNPSLVLNLMGCSLRCRFCQQGENLHGASTGAERLEASLWSELSFKGARSLSFVGGNPDQSLDGILRFLSATPDKWKLPLVWNCNGYGTWETLSILDGLVDVYIPDFKFGTERCARELAEAPGYPKAAEEAISAMVGQGVTVVVRILVLPGHHDCCHLPALEHLAKLNRENLFISVRGQYCPDWEITPQDGPLARRTSREETEAVRLAAKDFGLRLAPE